MTYAQHSSPPALPAGAIGFLCVRHDRPERLALYHPDGRLSNTFGLMDSAHQIAHECSLRLESLTAAQGDDLALAHHLRAWSPDACWAVFRKES